MTAVAQPAPSSTQPAPSSTEPAPSSSDPPVVTPFDNGRRLYVALRAGMIATSFHSDSSNAGDQPNPAIRVSGSGLIGDFEIGMVVGRVAVMGYLEISQPQLAMATGWAAETGLRGRYCAVTGLCIGGGIGSAAGPGYGFVFTANADVGYRLPQVGPTAVEVMAIVEGGYLPGLPGVDDPDNTDSTPAHSTISGQLELGVVF